MLKKHRDDGNKARTRGKSSVGARRRVAREPVAGDDTKPRSTAKKSASRKPSKTK
jgi:hypothetical protein